MTGTLLQLNVSNGGMPKTPVISARVDFNGLAGDWQLNRKYHGGPDRAICIFSLELYDWLRQRHQIDLNPGSVGENFTTRGIDLQQLSPGNRLRVGECVIEITKVRVPCRSLQQWHPKLMKLVQGHSGWMAKVIQPAEVRVGDAIELIEAK